MRESEHFNLNLVEGSDIVNPLVTDVPNYESIDEQLFKNQNAGVQNATELKTGTVHAITRLVPDAQMITFTATSNFVAGDTFTVDGIQVSALTVSGEQLPTGAYVINSQVLAILKGTLLTVYGIGSEVADNSLALNGHPDTYFGTKEDVDNAIDTANAAKNLVNEISNDFFNIFNESSTPTKTPFVDENGKEIYHICLNANMVKNGQTIINWSPSNISRIILMIPIFNSIDGTNYCGVDLQNNGSYSERASSVSFRPGVGLVVRSTIDGACKCHIWYTI